MLLSWQRPTNIPANVIVSVLADASVVQSHGADLVGNGLSDVRVPKHLSRLSGHVSALVNESACVRLLVSAIRSATEMRRIIKDAGSGPRLAKGVAPLLSPFSALCHYARQQARRLTTLRPGENMW